ncbi:MAG TPA: type I-U CRISPR-associated protein Csx17 [Candidatus Baltobacteraceae bacterium]|jgi:CRISPR-associated protein Csx17|nr:type I-U CRISPR-associated protein Csx17 [Candidatus Baltobacteraceae bacterium]
MIDTIPLDGCRTTPLAGYLKALGILRIVAEQSDDMVAGFWQNERFHLRTTLSRETLRRFFLDVYTPTPIIAPWNGGSGFYPKDAKEGITAIAKSTTKRFAPYKTAIAMGAGLIAKHGLNERPTKDDKRRLIDILRTEADDAVVSWMDSAVSLLSDDLDFPPLLGTGGNDGRLDFTNNFMQRLIELIDPASGTPRINAALLLDDSLFAEPTIGMASVAIGQFSPGAAGGPNGSTGYEAQSSVNPWDFILMLEGALLFAGGVSRRLESSDHSFLSSPFTFRAIGAGFGTSSLEEQTESRGEIWMPLWLRPALASEVRVLFREGRLSLGTRRVRDGLDAARAAAGLGADRRIAAFERYGFVKRQGLAYLAVPLGRRNVKQNKTAELASDLYEQGWLDKVRREATASTAPSELRDAVHSLEDALFDLTATPSNQSRSNIVQAVLIALGKIVRILAVRPKLWEQLPPPPRLRRNGWIQEADDETPEFRIAAALAALYARAQIQEASGTGHSAECLKPTLPMRAHLAPLDPDKANAWDVKEAHIAVWGNGDLCTNLCTVGQRRLIEATRHTFEDKPFHSIVGAGRADIATFLERSTDDERIAELLAGLAWVFPEPLPYIKIYARKFLPLSYAALKPLFVPDTVLAELHRYRQESPLLPKDTKLPIPAELPSLLMARPIKEAVRRGMERARASGLPTPFIDARTHYSDGHRLFAALMIPVQDTVVRDCLNQAYLEQAHQEKEPDDDRSDAS